MSSRTCLGLRSSFTPPAHSTATAEQRGRRALPAARISRRIASWTLACLPLATAACVESEFDGDLAADEQEIYANKNLYWPGAGTSRVDIPVCFENPHKAPGATAAARASWRDARRQAVEGAWGRFGRIAFYGWDGNDPVNNPRSCAAGEAGLHVLICENTTLANGAISIDARCAQSGASQSNNPATSISGYPGLNGTKNGIRMNPAHPPSVWVHEFGHALGYYHEEEIPGAAGKCQEQSWPNANPIQYGAYDSTSIMSYCNPPTTAPFLSPNDIAAVQRSYGRRLHGSLTTPRGNCAASRWATGIGDLAFVWDCDEANHDQEFLDTLTTSDGDARNLYLRSVGTSTTKYCLAADSATSGSLLRLASCSTSTDWLLRSMYVRGFGGLCLDLRNGDTTPGTAIQLWTCGALGGGYQRWSLTRDGHIKYGDGASNRCAEINGAGRLVIATCASTSGQIFSFADGKITRASSGKCVDAQGPSDAQYIAGQSGPGVGTYVQEQTCNTSLNQKWNLSGALRYGANASLCMARAGADGNGTVMTLATCNGAAAQEWDYFF